MTAIQGVVAGFAVGVVGFALGLAYAITRRRLLARQVNSLLWQISKRDQALKAATGKRDAIDRLVDDVRRETRDHQLLRDRVCPPDAHDVFEERD